MNMDKDTMLYLYGPLLAIVVIGIIVITGIIVAVIIVKKKKIRMYKVMAAILICAVVVISILYSTCWAVGRKAIRETEFGEYNNYIIVQEIHATSTGWRIIGDEKGYFKEEKEDIEIELSGNVPPWGVSPNNYGNSYLCIVEKEGKKESPKTSEVVDFYNVEEWYPVYPVLHSEVDRFFSKWPGSKEYLTKDEISDSSR